MNDDEVEFLDSVLESSRAKEAAVKKQTAEELDAFRRQQEEAERATKTSGSSEAADTTDTTSWAVSRKRKKGREDILGGVKLRKASSGDKVSAELKQAGRPSATAPLPDAKQKDMSESERSTFRTAQETDDAKAKDPEAKGDPPSAPPTATATPGLGLGAYSSDEDD